MPLAARRFPRSPAAGPGVPPLSPPAGTPGCPSSADPPVRLLALLVGVALIALTACRDEAADRAAPPPQGRSDILMTAGDHLTLDGRTVVLADAETPQVPPMAHCAAEAMAGAQTVRLVRILLATANRIDVGPADGHGTALVKIDGLDLGRMLILQRLAVPRAPQPMKWCAEPARQRPPSEAAS